MSAGCDGIWTGTDTPADITPETIETILNGYFCARFILVKSLKIF